MSRIERNTQRELLIVDDSRVSNFKGRVVFGCVQLSGSGMVGVTAAQLRKVAAWCIARAEEKEGKS